MFLKPDPKFDFARHNHKQVELRSSQGLLLIRKLQHPEDYTGDIWENLVESE